MSALEKYIQKLQDPVPEFRDPEDIEDETAARLAPRAAESEVSGQQPSALRRRAAAVDWFEGGRKTSRKELYEEDEADLEMEEDVEDEEEGEDVEEEEEEEIESEIEEEEGVGEEEIESEIEEEEGEEEEESEIEEEEKDGEMFEEEEQQEEESESEIEEDEEGGMFGKDAEESEEEDVKDQDGTQEEGGAGEEDVANKAKAVVQQLDLWDRLMEARIQLQKVLSLSNRLLPSQDPHNEQLATARESLEDMGMKLNSVVEGGGESHDETSRKRKADMDIEELARQSHESLATERNKVMTFWAQKTQLVSKKFKNFNKYQTPVVKQVEQILSDRDRLIRRTQVIRDDSADLSEKPEEVFDDGDFYQRLLKNLIDSKATELSKASSSASQWLEVQRMRGKKKKNKDVDTRASKGRKLRYNVHSKLVNFMFPRDTSTWSEDAKNDLFKNLFKMPSQAEM